MLRSSLTASWNCPRRDSPQPSFVATVNVIGGRHSAQVLSLGAWGEARAAEYLQDQRFEILDRNWRHRLGEIDIVARDGLALVVVEVKTRRSRSFGAPVEAITDIKLLRLRQLAGAWLREHPEIRPRQIRIDVVGIDVGPFHLDHRRGVI